MIAILGSGAVGALLAARFADCGVAARVVTTERSAEAIGSEGITVESPVFATGGAIDVEAVTALEVSDDVVVVAVKAPHLVAALDRLAGEPAAVIPLLNGVEHMALLRARFANVVAATVKVQAARQGLTTVIHRAPFLTVTVAQPGEPTLATALGKAGIDHVRGDDETTVLWAKLSRLAALALSTTAADAPLGDVRPTAEAVAREVAAVANAEGAAIDAGTVVAELRGLPDAASSSLRADVAAGVRDHELDAIGGAVLRAAARRDLAVPETSSLVARIANL
jgi:2-dehydropantoate 2-reductase